MASKDTKSGKVTIIDLFLLCSLFTPIGVALAMGWEAGIAGIAVGLVIGSIIGVGGFLGMYSVDRNMYQWIKDITSNRTQDAVFCLVFLGMFVWSFGSGLLAGFIVKLINIHIFHVQYFPSPYS